MKLDMQPTLVLAFLLLFGGCSIFSSEEPVLIRVQNSSSLEMEDVTVRFPEQEVMYGDIDSGEYSSYTDISKAYRYAYFETIAGDKKVVLQPIDYVGESYLEEGKYTYVLNIHEESYQQDDYPFALTLSLQRD
ncbi:MAG: hypothetical protein U5K69_11055 [Balneolaceae bacterium]|nr:hypothetical protein [Balneolaceae bacterium]